jgi:hypothetical protein
VRVARETDSAYWPEASSTGPYSSSYVHFTEWLAQAENLEVEIFSLVVKYA